LGLRQFAKAIGRDPSVVCRWETGDRLPQPTEVARILGRLEVTGRKYDEIMELAYGADAPRWFATTVPEQRAQLATLLDFEQTATVISDVAPLLIPGLLQTSNYTRAVMTEGGLSPEEITTRTAIRAGRREALSRKNPVTLNAYIDEAVLNRRIGTPEIMAEQLGLLHDMAGWSTVDIRVMPLDSGWHPGLEGSFILIDSKTELPVVYREVYGSGLFLHDDAEIDSYRAALARVAGKAMSAEDSLVVIALAKAGWESP
jgi:hypothetical protein